MKSTLANPTSPLKCPPCYGNCRQGRDCPNQVAKAKKLGNQFSWRSIAVRSAMQVLSAIRS